MKTYLVSLGLMVYIFFSACQEQTNVADSSELSQEDFRAMVTQTVNKLNVALLNRDSALLDTICSEGLSYGHSSGAVQDKSKFIDDVLNGSFRYLTIDNQNQRISIHEDVAIVRDILVANGISRGDSVTIRIGNSQLYKLSNDGSCRLIFRQAYRL